MRTTLLCTTLWTALLVLAASAPAAAQGARPRVSAAGVTGLELALEGDLSAPRGGVLRWLVTGYEVVGLSELRPAPGVRVHATSSLRPTEDAALVRADAGGRALVEVPVPVDAPSSFRVVLRLVTEAGVQRRFELPVQAVAGDALELHLTDSALPLGAPAQVLGRLVDARSARPRADTPVRLTLRDDAGRPLGAPAELRTDPAGLFAHAFPIPRSVRGGIQVEARAGTDEHPVLATARAVVGTPRAEPLLVAVAPARPLVRPGERVELDVVVRTPQGRPVEGAVLRVEGTPASEADRHTRTDAQGRARLAWTAPAAGTIHDAPVRVTAQREGLGAAVGQASVRVATVEHAVALAVEGGALSPELGGRVWVRVVGADGRPAGAGVPVRLEGPRLSGSTQGTDDDGVARFDVSLGPTRDVTADRCGGESATALEIRVGAALALSPCLPLDPDAAARVRVGRPIVAPGAALELTVERTRAAARAPVELSILAGSARALAHHVLGPDETQASVALPPDVSGLVWVRARPLIGARQDVVRGGVASAWVRPGQPFGLEAALGPDGTLRASPLGAPSAHAFVVAAPLDAARPLADALRASALGPFADLRVDPARLGDALALGALAAQTPPDVGASAVLRGTSVVALPDPEQPSAVGLLRDPRRARARFVTGRLALVLHALERYVAEALPERLDDVAVGGPRGFELNSQVLESVAASGTLGPAGATGLGGEPLTIEQLRAFDVNITYDTVAQRITRERMFRLLVALRAFTQSRGFDLPWSRLGDPSDWLRQLVGQYVDGVGSLDRRHMVDGWGRPFRLMPARGGRSRFTFVDPLGSWELVSAGPDGRFGTADDAWDPTARVLPSGTPYAEAVGEDVLVARLAGVELGRASLELLTRADPSVGAVRGIPRTQDAMTQAGQALWSALPSLLEPDPEPLALRRPAHPGRSVGGRLTRLAPGARLELGLDEEPRTWGAVVYAWSPEGAGAVALATGLGGAPLIVEGELPSRLRVEEPLTVELTLTNLRDEALVLEPRVEGEGFTVRAPETLRVEAGRAEPLTLRVEPSAQPGRGRVRLVLAAEGRLLRTLEWPAERVTGRHPIRLRAAGPTRGGGLEASIPVPADATGLAGRVVVLAPSALAGDPDLAELRRRDPALVAWSDAMAGRRSDPALWSRLLLAQQPHGAIEGDDPVLSTACGALALASRSERDDEAGLAAARAREFLAGVWPEVHTPESVRGTAALLAALVSSGVPEGREGGDPVQRAAARARARLRRVLRLHPDEPTSLARAAAALLLADPADAYGVAMLERAVAQLEPSAGGGARVRPSEARRDDVADALAATLALAVAAHQLDRAELATRLLRGGLAHEHVALRRGGEAAFWVLAAGAFGALGADPEAVSVEIDGQRQELRLEQGRGVLPLASRPGARHDVRVEAPEGRGALVRVEVVAERPFVATAGRSLALALGGDVGDVDTGSALELSVRALRALSAPVVELSMPAGVRPEEGLLSALRGAPHVRQVEERDPGFLRIHLRPMASGTEATLPLPLRWGARGLVRGLGAVGYPADDPADMSVLPPRDLTL